MTRLDEVALPSRPSRSGGIGTDSKIPFIPMALLPNDGLPTTRWEMHSAGEVRSGVPFAEGDSLLAEITPCLENGKLGIPPLPEQREIAAQLSTVDSRLTALESRRAALAALFTSLLHHLMTARLRLLEFVKDIQ
jgi:hypothetical protein